ncbi:HAD family hydrolase [Bdellovibrionota bacterium FG-1]
MSKNPSADWAPLVRKQWVSACHFHDLSETEVLHEVARRVIEVNSKAEGRKQAHPLVLLDLDSTLYEVGPRTYRILCEWMDLSSSQQFPGVCRALQEAEPWHVGYSVKDTLEAVGLDVLDPEVAAALPEIKAFWVERFFTSTYLHYDHAYPGAPEFTRKVHALGAEIVYLTGRDEPGMGEGTRANLLRDGFPWQMDRTHLLMKSAAHVADLDHKKDAAHYIREHGTLVASFENEPPNLVALAEIFPDAMHVFVDTVCSEHPTKAYEGLYRIGSFF